MRRYLAVVMVAFFALLTAAPAFAAATADDGVIGTILEVEGSASVTPAGGQPAAAAINTSVHLNDVVQTAAASRVFILFIDNTELTLSENTQVRVDNYVFDPADKTNNKASYSVMQGAFQYVSGLIGKKDNPDVHIDSPVGSIGIRGTNFWAGNLDDQYSVAVHEGQVALKTDAGEEVVNKGQGTSVQDRHSIPSHAEVWPPEKFRRVNSTIHLQRLGLVRQKIRGMQGRQIFLRARYKNYMAQHGSPNQPTGIQLRNQLRNQQQQTQLGNQQQKRQPGQGMRRHKRGKHHRAKSHQYPVKKD